MAKKYILKFRIIYNGKVLSKYQKCVQNSNKKKNNTRGFKIYVFQSIMFVNTNEFFLWQIDIIYEKKINNLSTLNIRYICGKMGGKILL